jgi:hypothetical protein
MMQFTPVYKATAIIAVEQPGEGVSQREATLKSWALAEKVILKLNLTRDPEINTALTSRSFYRISTWFTAARQREDIVVPPGTQTLTLKPPLLAAFAARLEVIPAGANTIRITFRSEDPAKAARIANAVAAQLPLEQPPAGTAAGPAAELAPLAGQARAVPRLARGCRPRAGAGSRWPGRGRACSRPPPARRARGTPAQAGGCPAPRRRA